MRVIFTSQRVMAFVGIPNVASWRATMAGISNYAILRAIFDVFNTVTAFSAANSLNVPRLASIISQFICRGFVAYLN